MYHPRDTTQALQDDRVREENKDHSLSNKQPYPSTAGTNYVRSIDSLYRQPNKSLFADLTGHTPFPSQRTKSQIRQIGEGTTVAGQSTEYFATRSRVSLCYQCCKLIPLRTLISTRGEPCGSNACRRTREAGLEFIPMPQEAAGACEEFLTFLIWWMDKVDLGVDKAIGRRTRHRVREMRDDIPDATPYES